MPPKRKTPTKKSAPRKTQPPKKGAGKKPAPKKGAAKKPVPKKGAGKKPAPKKGAKKPAPKKEDGQEKAVEGGPKKRSRCHFKNHIAKVLKDVAEGYQIKEEAKLDLNSILLLLGTTVTCKARSLCSSDSKPRKTINDTAVKTACTFILPPGIYDEIMATAEDKWEKMEEAIASGKTYPRREGAVDLHLSVSETEHILRGTKGFYDFHISKKSPVILASVLESVCALFLERAAEKATAKRMKTISSRHLMLASYDDENLKHIITKLSVVFGSAGVVPFIDRRLTDIPKETKDKLSKQRRKNAQKRKKAGNGAAKGGTRRKLPGQMSVKNAKEFQGSTGVFIQCQPFANEVRERVARHFPEETKIRFGKDSILVLQFYIERRIADLCRKAQEVALHSSRQRVNGSDIRTVLYCQGLSIPDLPTNKKGDVVPLEDVFTSVKNNNIQRLSQQGGAIGRSSDIYDTIRLFIESVVDPVAINVHALTVYDNIVTVKKQTVREAIYQATGDTVL